MSNHDPLFLLRRLNAAEIQAKLLALRNEERALKVLLRAAKAKEGRKREVAHASR